jgi:arginine decarboxylase-like protein
VTAPPPLRLPPLLAGVGEKLTGEKALLRSLIDGYGSPCHLVFPEEFAKRVEEFQHAFGQVGVRGHIYYGAKANKAESFLEVAARCGIGIDVSSRQEMSAALTAGVRGRQIMVTGPDKGVSLHRLALAHDACIAIDSVHELQPVIAVARDAPGGPALGGLAGGVVYAAAERLSTAAAERWWPSSETAEKNISTPYSTTPGCGTRTVSTDQSTLT